VNKTTNSYKRELVEAMGAIDQGEYGLAKDILAELNRSLGLWHEVIDGSGHGAIRRMEERKSVDERLEELASERARRWKNLEKDFDIDENHHWRARQHEKLAEIEKELAAIDDEAERGRRDETIQDDSCI